MKKILLIATLMLLPQLGRSEVSGNCGDGVIYTYNEDTQTLTISGNGKMWDFSSNDYIPWYQYRDKIESIVIKEGVSYIGYLSFQNCTAVKNVEIPPSINKISSFAFMACTNLNSVLITDLESWCNISFALDSYRSSNPLTYAHHLFLNGEEIEKLIVPEGVNEVGDLAFSGCEGLTTVTIPEGVSKIGSEVFRNCSNLLYISLPNSVSSIGGSSFSGCSKIESIVLPTNLSSIEKYLFYNCSSLISVKIPNSVTNIGPGAFLDCSSLITIDIPNSLTSFGADAFSGCSGLLSINIPDGITSIPTNLFKNCSGLVSVNIPNSVVTIGDNAFQNCYALSSLKLPSDLNVIGKYSFSECRSITSLKIPDSVTSIGENAFFACSDLISLTLPNNISTIRKNTYSGCTSLTSLIIPDNVTIIEEDAFNSCSSLKNVKLPEGLSILRRNAFAYCSDLSDIVLPERVEYIYINAFAYCYGLKKVTVLAENPPYVHEKAFYNYDIPLYVPSKSLASYLTAETWKNFASINPISGEEDKKGICENPQIIYNRGVLSFECETSDVEFHYSIKDTDIMDGIGNNINLSITYRISVWASKEDFEDSEVSTATLCWLETDPKTEGITDAVVNIRAKAVVIQNNNNVITISGTEVGTPISIFDASGNIVGSTDSTDEITNIPTSLKPGSIAIIKVDDRIVKIIMK